jgi:hypothetical protein
MVLGWYTATLFRKCTKLPSYSTNIFYAILTPYPFCGLRCSNGYGMLRALVSSIYLRRQCNLSCHCVFSFQKQIIAHVFSASLYHDW